jgi:hypothetical protein
MENVIFIIPRSNVIGYRTQCCFSKDMMRYIKDINIKMLNDSSYFAKDFYHTFGLWMKEKVGHKMLCVLFLTSVLLNKAIDGYAQNFDQPEEHNKYATLQVLAHMGYYCLLVTDD